MIALVLAVFSHVLDQGAAIDRHVGLEALRLNGLGMLGEQKIRDDDHRALVFLREVKGFDGRIETIGRIRCWT